MATIKTIQLTCPYCGKKLRATPYNDHCAIRSKLYGNPNEICPKCKKTYLNAFLIEPAVGLTLKEKVPFLATSQRLLAFEIVIAVFFCTIAFMAEVPEALLGVIIIAAFHLAISAATMPYRQRHKDKLVASSRERLKEPEYFIKFLMSNVTSNAKAQLTPQLIAAIHNRAVSEMEADKVLDLKSIVQSIR